MARNGLDHFSGRSGLPSHFGASQTISGPTPRSEKKNGLGSSWQSTLPRPMQAELASKTKKPAAKGKAKVKGKAKSKAPADAERTEPEG